MNGFNENSRELTANKAIALVQTYEKIVSIEFTNVIFDFYQQGKLLTSEECKRENFDSKTNFFGQMRMVLLTKNVLYNNKICPLSAGVCGCALSVWAHHTRDTNCTHTLTAIRVV